jgi:uncharacterized glyoxalase superfamily protein PhnB
MQNVYPVLKYDDPHAAIDFLERAFGFERLQIHEDDGGKVAHAELRCGDGIVALYDSAKAAGAEIVLEPTDQDYGSRDFSVRDPEGNIWAFGTYQLGD